MIVKMSQGMYACKNMHLHDDVYTNKFAWFCKIVRTMCNPRYILYNIINVCMYIIIFVQCAW